MPTQTKIGGRLVIGLGALTAGVLATSAVNSLIAKGDVIFDTASNTTPAIVVNTTDIMEFSTNGTNTLGTASGRRLEVRPSAGSGVLRIRSAPGPAASGGLLCIEDLGGSVDVCFSSGGRLDCDTDSRGLCN